MAMRIGWTRAGSKRRFRCLDADGSSYVSPAVVEQYLDGRTIEDFRPRDLRVVGARDVGLDPEEGRH